MFKPPRGIKYNVVKKEELEARMATDSYLIDVMKKRTEAQAEVDALKAEHRARKSTHNKAFWSLWKTECELAKKKIKLSENVLRWKTGWQKRCWQLYKLLKLEVSRAKRKKN